MAFFSGGRRGGGGGLLPSTSKPKPVRKSFSATARRRSHLRDLLSPTSSFFALGLFVSFLFFLAVVIRYGVPNPLSSSHSKPRLARRPAFRRPADAAGAPGWKGDGIVAAAVDITTKDLYDRIEFLDRDGGAWKQGWKVTYVGNEWDEEKLKVFVVPHSHNDPGWKMTVEEYYNRQSRHILDTIVESLSKVKICKNPFPPKDFVFKLMDDMILLYGEVIQPLVAQVFPLTDELFESLLY